MKPAVFTISMLYPRYWLTWLGFILLAFAAQLPYRLQIFLGQQVGNLLYRIAGKRRVVAQRNLSLCFPELDDNERLTLLKKHFQTNGIALFETGMAWFMPYWRLRKRFVLKGETHWRRLQAEGQGALVLSLHFNTLEIVNVMINRTFDLYMTYRPHKNLVYDYIQRRGRERHNPDSKVVSRKDIRGMVKVLKSGGWLNYFPDQDYGRRVSEFVPWFGIPTATVAATPRLLKMSKTSAVALQFRRLPNYQGYEIECLPAFPDLPSGDDYADLVTINRYIEDTVRCNKAEYLWVHRRFKTRPESEDSLY